MENKDEGYQCRKNLMPLTEPLTPYNLKENEKKRKKIKSLYVPRDFGFPKFSEGFQIEKGENHETRRIDDGL
ncbi:hypothetical protein [Dubosiella newyorkensis]|uniref:hypothetical protein n=1 Tax=Dubosiella newyorkensis TaxID=1862672 RepID=UPI00272EB71B|nr:hypothetical protein [Dubosiella newyorkensis]